MRLEGDDVQTQHIPTWREMGRVFPPEDCWEEPDTGNRREPEAKSSRRSLKKKSCVMKADSMKRLKVPRPSKNQLAEEEDSSEAEESSPLPAIKQRNVAKAGGKGRGRQRK